MLESDSTRPATTETGATVFFASFRMEPDGTLFRGSELVHLPPRELAALRLLIANSGQVVSPSQIKQSLWGAVNVTTDSIPKCLSSLRARLLPDECIQTVYKRGYRLKAEVDTDEPRSVKALPRLVIPPFANERGLPEHLGATIAEETIFRLSNADAPLAFILARDSVFTLARRGLTAQQIGETLQADLAISGTLRNLNGHIRLRVEMIRVVDGVQIWVEDLLVKKGCEGELEPELACRLQFRFQKPNPASGNGRSLAFKGEMNHARSQESANGVGWSESVPFIRSEADCNVNTSELGSAFAHSPDPRQHEAYESFLRGHYEWQSMKRHRMQDGMQHLSRAIELDPSLIPAKVDLAHLCVAQAIYGYMAPATSAKTVRRTVESIPHFPARGRFILPALAWNHFYYDRDLNGALRAFELCADLPHSESNTRARSFFWLSRKRFAEAISLLSDAVRQDPFSSTLHARLAWALHLDGRAEESVAQIEKALEVFPDSECTAIYGAMILGYNEGSSRAVELIRGLTERQPDCDLATAIHAYALAQAGHVEEAQRLLEQLQWLRHERFVAPSFTPAIHVALGDHDAALAELRGANDARCPWFFQMLADPRLMPLHGRTEFRDLEIVLDGIEESSLDSMVQN